MTAAEKVGAILAKSEIIKKLDKEFVDEASENELDPEIGWADEVQ